jgi:hypothetical protein
MLRDAVLGYQDLPFAVLVVSAVLLEARKPRRGVAVLVLLALAGLLRPEAWVLSGLYWLYLWPRATGRERLRLAALAVSAPLIWAGSDWIVAGDPLHSLHGTAALAEEADRRRSPEDVPYWTAAYFGYALREPMVIGVPLGLAFAWLYMRRRALLPAVVVVAMTAVFAIGPLFGLPLIRRYIETPAVLLTIFYGLAVCGWSLLRPSLARTRWMALGGLAVALSVVYIPWHVDKLDGVSHRMHADKRMYGTLKDIVEAPRLKAAFARCPSLTAADHRPIPYVRFWLDAPPGSVTTVEGGASRMGGLLLVPRRTRATVRMYTARSYPLARVRRARLRLDILHRHRVGLLVVHPEELRVGLDDRRRLVPHAQPALVHPDALVAELLDAAERVADEQDRAVLVAELAQPPERLAAEARVADRQRLVHDQDVRVHGHGDREREPPVHA